jgi:flagellar hook-length control protein FliK
MAVLSVSPIASAPSSRGQPSDGSATDPNGFGSLLGGVVADAPHSGGTAGGARSDAAGPQHPASTGKTAPPHADGAAAGASKRDADKDKDASEPGDARPAKAAEQANGATPSHGAKGFHPAGKRPQPHGKGKAGQADDDQPADGGTEAAAAASVPQTATLPDAAPIAAAATAATGASQSAIAPDPAGATAVTAAAATAGAAAPVTAVPAAAAAAPVTVVPPTAAQPGDGAASQAIAPALSAPIIDPAAPQAAAVASPSPAAPPADGESLAVPSAATAFGNALLDPAVPVSPLSGNPAVPATGLAASQATAPSAPAAAPSAPIQLLSPLPETGAAPKASAAPQESIAPGITALTSLLAEITADAGPIIVQALPHGAGAANGAGLHGGKGGTPGVSAAAGAPAANFGNALLSSGVPGVAAALLGGSDDQPGDLADRLLQSAGQDLAEGSSAAAADKSSAETVALDSVPANGHAAGLSVPSFAAALAHADAAAPTGSTGTASPAPAPAPLPHLPALQILPSLAKAAGDGGGRFNIQLHPQELGRVRVELDIDHDGHVTAAISAAHPATLDLLRRDAAALQQALNDAGLKTDGNALSFNLQGNGQDMTDGSARSARHATPLVPPAADPLADDAAPQTTGTVSLGAGLVAVDIRI